MGDAQKLEQNQKTMVRAARGLYPLTELASDALDITDRLDAGQPRARG